MLKRSFDFLATVLGVLVLSPFLLVLVAFVWLKMGRPILFAQVRPGKNEKPFKLFKFRTMTNERDDEGHLLPNDQRLTKFGRFLRSTSLDEFPGLFNVVKGDMSLVGPRPLLMEYLPYYTDEQEKRHLVRPGITGWAQVNGRNAIEWEHKFKLDVWYIKNRTFWLDLKILYLTLIKVLRKQNIMYEESTTMPKFSETKDANETTET